MSAKVRITITTTYFVELDQSDYNSANEEAWRVARDAKALHASALEHRPSTQDAWLLALDAPPWASLQSGSGGAHLIVVRLPRGALFTEEAVGKLLSSAKALGLDVVDTWNGVNTDMITLKLDAPVPDGTLEAFSAAIAGVRGDYTSSLVDTPWAEEATS